jgi:hypothetical protein
MLPALHQVTPRFARPAFLLVVAVLACSDSHRGTGSVRTEIDTIADTIVARTAGTPDSGDTHRLVVETSIGEADGADEYTFSAVADIAVGREGQMYVWDGTLKSLRLYDSTGKFVRTIGAPGAGPGEYQSSNGMAVDRRGRLIFWDPRNSRVNVYTAAGDLETTWRIDGGFYTTRDLFVDTAGNTYLHRTVWRDPVTRDSRMGYVRVDPDGVIADTLEPRLFGTAAPTLKAARDGASVTWSIPFHPERLSAFSPLGYFVSGPGEPYVVYVLRTDGLPIRIERAVDRPKVDPAEKAERREEIVFSMRQTVPDYRWDGPDIPDLKASYRELRVADDGRIWVRISQPSERIPEAERSEAAPPNAAGQRPPVRTWREPIVYEVFEPTGEFLGRIALPARTTIVRMRGNNAWGAVVDSLDIPYATRFRIEPGLGVRK